MKAELHAVTTVLTRLPIKTLNTEISRILPQISEI